MVFDLGGIVGKVISKAAGSEKRKRGERAYRKRGGCLWKWEFKPSAHYLQFWNKSRIWQ